MNTLLFALVRNQLLGTEIPASAKKLIKENMRDIYALATPQGFGPMVGQAFSDAGLLGDDDLSQAIQTNIMKSFTRRVQQDYEFCRICECLRVAQICYVPLKGAVVRKLYPHSWMRTSSDIDILVKEESVDTAIATLKKNLNYTQPGDREYHDVSLFSPSGVHLELHFSLKENNEKMDKILNTVWENTKTTENIYELELTPEFFVYHMVSHCAYHFMSSGCGGKAVMDLWLLKHKMGYDESVVRDLCADSGLEQFYEQITKLGQVWFSQEESTPLLDEMGSYILNAGFGGSMENAVTAGILKNGGKNKYILRRLFLPYDMLRSYYPVLNRHKWLTPICQIRRWISGIKRRGAGAVIKECQSGTAVSDQALIETKELFQKLELL